MTAVQSAYGKLSIFEDFFQPQTSVTLSAVSGYNDVMLIPVSGNFALASTTDESGGVLGGSGAGAAADGLAISSNFGVVPGSSNAPAVFEVRLKNSSASDWRLFVGWQETVVFTTSIVNPFTLSGTTLTANNGGNVVGFYTDTGATTDDFRFMASVDGTASTTAAVKVMPLFQSVSGQSTTTLGSLGVRAGATLTADQYTIFRVILNPDGSAEGWIGDATIAGSNLGLELLCRLEAGTLDTTAIYFPHVHMAANSTGDPTAEIDYYAAKGNRDWTV